jgi:nitrate reductase gamma subunit
VVVLRAGALSANWEQTANGISLSSEVRASQHYNERVNAWVSPLMLSFFLCVDLLTCLNYQDTAFLLWTLLAFTLTCLFVFQRLVHSKRLWF